MLQALFEALKDGAAADLIELDLRGNPFSVDDLNRLVRCLLAFSNAGHCQSINDHILARERPAAGLSAATWRLNALDQYMPFCQPLLATLQAYLWKSRKQLSVLVGAQKAQQPTVSLSPFALQANEFVEVEEIEGVAKDSSPVPANASPLGPAVLPGLCIAMHCALPHLHMLVQMRCA